MQDPSRSGSFTDEKTSVSDAELIHGTYKSLDVGLKLVTGHSDEPEVSPEESKRLRRKIDRHLLPMLCVIYTGACPSLSLVLPSVVVIDIGAWIQQCSLLTS